MGDSIPIERSLDGLQLENPVGKDGYDNEDGSSKTDERGPGLPMPDATAGGDPQAWMDFVQQSWRSDELGQRSYGGCCYFCDEVEADMQSERPIISCVGSVVKVARYVTNALSAHYEFGECNALMDSAELARGEALVRRWRLVSIRAQREMLVATEEFDTEVDGVLVGDGPMAKFAWRPFLLSGGLWAEEPLGVRPCDVSALKESDEMVEREGEE